MKKEKLEEVFRLCMEIQNGETPMVAFFDYSGHCDFISFSVRESSINYTNTLLSAYCMSDVTNKIMSELREIHSNKDNIEWYKENIIKSSIEEHINEFVKLRNLGVPKTIAIKNIINSIDNKDILKIVKDELNKIN